MIGLWIHPYYFVNKLVYLDEPLPFCSLFDLVKINPVTVVTSSSVSLISVNRQYLIFYIPLNLLEGDGALDAPENPQTLAFLAMVVEKHVIPK